MINDNDAHAILYEKNVDSTWDIRILAAYSKHENNHRYTATA